MNDGKRFFEVIRDLEGKFAWKGHDFVPLGGNLVGNIDEDYDLTPEIQTAVTGTRYKINNINIDDEYALNTNKIPESGDYDRAIDSNSNGLNLLKMISKKRVDIILNLLLTIAPIENEEESDDLEGQGIGKIIIPFNVIEIWTKLEVFLGLKLSGHTDTLTEASNLIDDLYKRGEKQNEQLYRIALD